MWVILWWISRLRNDENQDTSGTLGGRVGKASLLFLSLICSITVSFSSLYPERENVVGFWPTIDLAPLNQLSDSRTISWVGWRMSRSPSQDLGGTSLQEGCVLRSTVETAVLSFLGVGARITLVLFFSVPPLPRNYTQFNRRLSNEWLHASINESLAGAP